LATVALAKSQNQNVQAKSAGMGFFWLCAFYLVYCARPEDWVHGLSILPLAKITGIAAILALLFATGRSKRKFRDLPSESYFLLVMLGVLLVSSLTSQVWKGGAISRTLDFSKVYVVWVLTFILVTDVPKLRRIIFLQAASVPVICLLSIIKGHSQPRLEGVLGGIYSNPNDLAFAIVLSLPFCLMFLLTARGAFRKLLWAAGMVIMCRALLMTGSRGGFITLLVAGVVCMWHFGVKGKRLYLIAVSGLVVVLLFATAGSSLTDRFSSMWSDPSELDTRQQKTALESYEQRQFLMQRAMEGIAQYPILGMGTRNFETYSTVWREVHMTYLQIAVEGGIVSLVLYLLFIGRGFGNLRWLLRRKDLSPDLKLFAAALHSSLIGFVVGALFSPEAYQYFPYFAVAYTSALVAYVKESDRAKSAAPVIDRKVPLPTYSGAGRVPVNT